MMSVCDWIVEKNALFGGDLFYFLRRDLTFFLEDKHRVSKKLTSCFHDVNSLLARSLFFIFTMLTSCFLFPDFRV